jgi:hypothetical protein
MWTFDHFVADNAVELAGLESKSSADRCSILTVELLEVRPGTQVDPADEI